MAFSGVHVVCGYGRSESGVPLLGRMAWAEKWASDAPGAVSGSRAPGNGRDGWGALVVSVLTSIDIEVAIAPAPDVEAGPVQVVLAGERYDFEVQPGDRVAWGPL